MAFSFVGEKITPHIKASRDIVVGGRPLAIGPLLLYGPLGRFALSHGDE